MGKQRSLVTLILVLLPVGGGVLATTWADVEVTCPVC
mgnify:CR=1 FL=1